MNNNKISLIFLSIIIIFITANIEPKTIFAQVGIDEDVPIAPPPPLDSQNEPSSPQNQFPNLPLDPLLR